MGAGPTCSPGAGERSYERVLKSDVKHRFAIDMASLKQQ
jgi:hypothetical protein